MSAKLSNTVSEKLNLAPLGRQPPRPPTDFFVALIHPPLARACGSTSTLGPRAAWKRPPGEQPSRELFPSETQPEGLSPDKLIYF